MKKILSIILILSLILCSTGCLKKKGTQQVEEEVTYSEEEYLALQQQVKQLENELAIYDESYKTKKAFKSKSVLPSGVMQFNKISDKIVLSNAPDTNSEYFTGAGLNSTIQLGKIISIDPTGWTIRTGTDLIEFYLNNNAYGKISLTKDNTDEGLDTDLIKYSFLTNFFKDNALETSNLQNIYLGQSAEIGSEYTAPIYIYDSTTQGKEINKAALQIFEEDELAEYNMDKDADVNLMLQIDTDKEYKATLRVGQCLLGEYILTYSFIELTPSGKTAVTSLLRTIQYQNNNVHLN